MNKKNLQFFMTPNGIVMYQGNDPEEIKKLAEMHIKVLDDRYERQKFLRSVPTIKKWKFRRNGKTYWLLGKTASGTKWYLEQPEYNCCNWYTNFGHIMSFTNNNAPQRAKDIEEYTRFETQFLEGDIFDSYKMFFAGGITVTDKELWQLLELFKEARLLEDYYEMLHLRGAHISSCPEEVWESIGNNEEKVRIRDKALPAVLNKIEAILEPEGK